MILRTNTGNEDFVELTRKLDLELAERDGEEHLFYDQFNKIDLLKYAVVAYSDKKSVGCGVMKEHEQNTMEIKRMYVVQHSRGQGIAREILSELEKWTSELNYAMCILETGKKQPEAIELYKRSGYKLIPNYGQYAGVENSVCFEKQLKDPGNFEY